MVELLADIKKLLEEHGVEELADEVDARLLSRLTIAEFFSLLDRQDLRHELARLSRENRRLRRGQHARRQPACGAVRERRLEQAAS
jgi:hypothetical protein